MHRAALFVSNFLAESGLNRVYAADLSDRLEARGWQITRTSSRLPKLARLADMLRTAWRSRRGYAVAHVDVFSGPAFVWAEAVCFELRRLGKPYMLTLRGGNLPAFSRAWPRRVRALLASARAVTVPSRYLAHHMAPYRPDVSVLPNAVDVTAYGFRTRRPASPRLVWLRAFHEIYNPALAVEVLARLPGATLRMVGPDKDGSRARVERRARELGVDQRLEIVGAVPKSAVAAELARGDIFLNTTNVDNSPVSVLEAMAAGLCVVSTNAGGIPYMLSHDRDALLVRTADPEAMAAAVERIVAEPDLAERLSTAARDTAAPHDWSSVLERWSTLLEGLAS
jgi:glycosyltransferase involved in cell wall biosynthesis